MKYALLAYDHGTLADLSAPEKRAIHTGHARLHRTKQAVAVLSHYRFRPPEHAITVRVEAGALIRDTNSGGGLEGTLRALYVVESDDQEAVVRFAAELPAADAGATVAIWPLSEPARRARG